LLVVWGTLGAFLGALLLSSLERYSQYTKPFISVYTLVLGVVILRKAFQVGQKRVKGKIKNISPLGFGGGFIDAVGGGGWGSIVLSTLIAGGRCLILKNNTSMESVMRQFTVSVHELTWIIEQ